MNRRKIGLMGGTFNPIHNGHIALAKAAYEYCGLDEVWFIPSGVSYLKKEDNIASGEHRLAMTSLAIEGMADFSCSDIEVRRKGNTYSIDTLRQLHKMYLAEDFYFIMGADSLFGFPKWKEAKGIAELCTLATVVRDDVDLSELQAQKQLLEQTLDAKIILVPFQKIDISSSDIRKKLEKRRSVEGMLPEKVLDYIYRNELYTEA